MPGVVVGSAGRGWDERHRRDGLSAQPRWPAAMVDWTQLVGSPPDGSQKGLFASPALARLMRSVSACTTGGP
jgi:hypothetical protein